MVTVVVRRARDATRSLRPGVVHVFRLPASPTCALAALLNMPHGS